MHSSHFVKELAVLTSDRQCATDLQVMNSNLNLQLLIVAEFSVNLYQMLSNKTDRKCEQKKEYIISRSEKPLSEKKYNHQNSREIL